MGTPQEVITKETIETVYGCEVWVDQNPVSGMPRISLLRKEMHEIEIVGRDRISTK
jgi:ABC-type cobalamin/Fe3+-siderophores transport system ATPase subunit